MLWRLLALIAIPTGLLVMFRYSLRACKLARDRIDTRTELVNLICDVVAGVGGLAVVAVALRTLTAG